MGLEVVVGGIIGFVVAFVVYFSAMVGYTIWKKKHPKKEKADNNELEEL